MHKLKRGRLKIINFSLFAREKWCKIGWLLHQVPSKSHLWPDKIIKYSVLCLCRSCGIRYTAVFNLSCRRAVVCVRMRNYCSHEGRRGGGGGGVKTTLMVVKQYESGSVLLRLIQLIVEGRNNPNSLADGMNLTNLLSLTF